MTVKIFNQWLIKERKRKEKYCIVLTTAPHTKSKFLPFSTTLKLEPLFQGVMEKGLKDFKKGNCLKSNN